MALLKAKRDGELEALVSDMERTFLPLGKAVGLDRRTHSISRQDIAGQCPCIFFFVRGGRSAMFFGRGCDLNGSSFSSPSPGSETISSQKSRFLIVQQTCRGSFSAGWLAGNRIYRLAVCIDATEDSVRHIPSLL